ncbi:unnamed protein product [Adineta steineri]|uniref:Uncharacterized protein n=1 Tax=Adineta steineri TaxID=433720 RepID=A0A820GGI8_9BILA|nr:unnamed protein product [Adineta steineri]CAF3763513.1 unnamed protein product [Adineta steineri]CAF4278079.1 unnamed protein product [Adineta steineri]
MFNNDFQLPAGKHFDLFSKIPQDKLSQSNIFSIHSIPKQSSLQLGGNKVLDHIVSSLTRSNGPGGIYPLSNNEQELFSLIYNHQGGPRH